MGQHLVHRLSEYYDTCGLGSSSYDLTDDEDSSAMFARHEADVAIHAAALCRGIGAQRPVDMLAENLKMSMNFLRGARLAEVPKVILISSVCAYPKNAVIPFKEDDLWNGYPEETNAPYGVAKKALLVMAQAYKQQYGLNSVYLLPVNLYGPGDHFDPKVSHVIPALIKKFVEAKKTGEKQVTVWGTGKATREFFYVDDAARAIVLAAEKLNILEPVNIGAGFEISVKALANLIKNLVGYKGKIVWDTSKPDGQPRRMLDTSKARKLFGFQAKTGFEEGLTKTISWYKKTQ